MSDREDRVVDRDNVTQVTVFVHRDLAPDDLTERIEHAICPDADDNDHTCALIAISRHPLHTNAAIVVDPGNDPLLAVRRSLIHTSASHQVTTDDLIDAKDTHPGDNYIDTAWLGFNTAAHYANVLAATLRVAQQYGADPVALGIEVAMMLADEDIANDHNDDLADPEDDSRP